MKHGERLLLCTVAGVALCTAASAVTSESPGNPYQGIVERNVFALKAPPPPPDPEANKPPPPKIFLQGITTILGNKRALFKVAAMPGKPGEQPKGEQSFILAEGERDGDIEVLEIDPAGGTVKVNEFGTVITLNFKDNAAAPSAAPAPMPGGVPNPFAPKPMANPFTPPGAAATPSVARPMRLPPGPGAASSVSPTSYGSTAAAGYGATAAYGGTSPSALALSSFGVTPAPAAAHQQAQTPISGEAQTILMVAPVVADKDKLFPPLPPSVAQLLGEGNNSAPPTPPTRPGPPQLPRAPSLPPLLPQ